MSGFVSWFLLPFPSSGWCALVPRSVYARCQRHRHQHRSGSPISQKSRLRLPHCPSTGFYPGWQLMYGRRPAVLWSPAATRRVRQRQPIRDCNPHTFFLFLLSKKFGIDDFSRCFIIIIIIILWSNSRKDVRLGWEPISDGLLAFNFLYKSSFWLLLDRTFHHFLF